MTDWTAHNKRVFFNGVTDYKNAIETRINKVFAAVAESVIVYIEGAGTIPVCTGNLSDSTGVGIYRNGQLTSYAPAQKAIVPQSYKGQAVWGYQELVKALGLAATEFSRGIWIVVFSSVPYAVKVEERRDYFEYGVVKDILSEFKRFMKTEFPQFKS